MFYVIVFSKGLHKFQNTINCKKLFRVTGEKFQQANGRERLLLKKVVGNKWIAVKWV